MADENGLIGIGVSYDKAWRRRNGGYSSSTDHGAAMGSTTGKFWTMQHSQNCAESVTMHLQWSINQESMTVGRIMLGHPKTWSLMLQLTFFSEQHILELNSVFTLGMMTLQPSHT